MLSHFIHLVSNYLLRPRQKNHYHAALLTTRHFSTMSFFLTNFLAAFLLPPLCFLPLLALAIFYFKRRPRVARSLLIVTTALLYIASTPFFVDAALAQLEQHHAAVQQPLPAADAIVILGGGSYFNAPEYDGASTVSEAALPRVRYGAHLYRATNTPILVTGGAPQGGGSSEAAQMRDVLTQDFLIPVRWLEEHSANTYENARNSYALLAAQGIRKIYLVTSASHMPRAAQVFTQAGFEVVAAPTAFSRSDIFGVMRFVPRAKTLLASKILLHELIGLLWYRIKS
ncbi:MAG: YdcF family protein [Gallionella sp.]